MYLKSLKIKNIGPIEILNYKLPFFDNGNPKPVIFVGENGSGKSIVLSYIVDSFFGFKRGHYEDIEIKEEKLFKLQSTSYIKNYENFGWVNLKYTHKDSPLFLTEVLSRIPYNEFIKKYQDEGIPNFNKDNKRFIYNGLFQNYTAKDKITKAAIDESVILYFPDNRFETPAWLDEEALKKREFKSKTKLITESRRKIIITDTLKNLEGWILDVVLDREINKRQFDSSLDRENNRIIKEILKNKYPAKKELRFGINPRKYGVRIGISNDILNDQGEREKVEKIVPSLYHLSSGESSLLVFFASILKDYDEIAKRTEFKLEDIEGIVVVDEIDDHLHIDLQRGTLPRLIKLFPKVQFIITTHSPFFLSGMKDTFGENIDTINLPDGNPIEVGRFSEFTKALDIFNKEGIKLKRELDKLRAKLNEITIPLIVTEGKSDWKHLKVAKGKLNIKEEFSFHEFEEDMGDGELLKLCKSVSKLKKDKVLIFIFDRDNSDILKKVENKNKCFKNWGNKVFSFAIPIPKHREGYKNISIEFYYSGDEIKTKDSNGRRLFLSSEFMEKSGCHKIDCKLKLANAKILKNKTDEKSSKIIDADVFNENEENVALPKSDFAKYIFDETIPFNNFKFDAFREMFDSIKSILNCRK